jgi:adenosine kinase
MKIPKVLVAGSIAYDTFLHYDKSFTDGIDPKSIDALSMSFLMESCTKSFGGTGLNSAWNIHLLGLSPLLTATVGKDGDTCLDLLKDEDMSTELITKLDNEMTANATIATDSKNHQITFFHRGASALRQWPKDTDPKKIGYAIIGPSPVDITLEGLLWCKENNIPCIFDPGQGILGFNKEQMLQAIEFSSGTVVNEYEAGLISTITDLPEEKLAKRTPYFVITHGQHGFVIYEGSKMEGRGRVNAENIINPTGAGDGFRAGLIYGQLHGWTLIEGCQLGAALASKIVEQEGALLPSVDMQELIKNTEETYGITLPKDSTR